MQGDRQRGQAGGRNATGKGGERLRTQAVIARRKTASNARVRPVQTHAHALQPQSDAAGHVQDGFDADMTEESNACIGLY
jgi:hypothetical protein